jgi:DNA-binding NarL/FixJ family response regulator
MEKTLTKSTEIMLVDDHRMIRNTLSQWLLNKCPNSEIITAISGKDALAILESHTVDLIIMDINMPGMNGIEATKAVKAIWPTIPIIVLTVKEDNYYRQIAVDAGADAYVIKRQIYAKLVPMIRALLQSKFLCH